MQINKSEKEILQSALTTELARVNRAAKAAQQPAIRDIYAAQCQEIQALQGRVFNEVAK